jgi:hypothetical protein
MTGWSILLVWYIIYLINAIYPILATHIIAVSHGVTGVTGTVLVIAGYYYLEKEERECTVKTDK